MAWQLLAAALPAAAKVAGTALSKPRQEDFAPQTDYMKKYLSYLRGRTSDREVMHLAMQPALRVAGKQGRQMQRQVGYDVAKSGLGGSGIEAQMRLSAGQQTQEALATATDKAVAAQAAETARVGERAAGITAQIGAEEARADQAFKSAESQWKRQLTSDVIGGVASVASAGIAQYGQNIAGFRQAVMDESIPAGTTYSQFKEMAKGGVIEGAPELGVPKAELGSMSPAEYAQHTGASKAKISGLRLAERIYGSSEAVQQRREQGISDADIISEAKRMQAMYVSAVGSGADPADINEAMRTLGFGNVTAPYVAETEGEDPAAVEEIVSTEETGQAGAKRGEKGVERSIVSTTDEPPVVKEEDKPPDKPPKGGGIMGFGQGFVFIKDDGSYSEESYESIEEAKAAQTAYKTKEKPVVPVEPVVEEPVVPVELPAGFIEGDYSTYPVKEFNGKPHHYDPRTGEAVMSTAVKPVAKEVKEIQELETVEEEPVEKTKTKKELLKEEALSLGLPETATRRDVNRAKYRIKEEKRIATKKETEETAKIEKEKAYKQALEEKRTKRVEKRIEEKQLGETLAIYEKEKAKTETEAVIAEGAKRVKYKALVNKPVELTRKGEAYKVMVDSVDLETKKVTFTHMGGKYTGKTRTMSLESFDKGRGVTSVATTKGETAVTAVTDDLLDAMLTKETGGATEATLLAAEKEEGAKGPLQHRDIFYKDVTKRMGFPEYDRNDPIKARAATKHYLEWVMKNEGLTIEEAVAAYNAGVEGQKKGIGKNYSADVFKILREMGA